MGNLKECPFCGNYQDQSFSLSDGNARVSCPCGCSMEYQTKTNETNNERLDAMIAQWNKRHSKITLK